MSSWQYAFLFPNSRCKLRPGNAFHQLADLGLEFDDKIRLCVSIDDEGHLLDVGEEIELARPGQIGLIRYLEQGASFSIQARNANIVLSCQLLAGSKNPHLSLGWSRRLFETLPAQSKDAFWTGIRAFARDCDAAYVLIVDDAPDFFEDRFPEIDGKRVLDLKVDHRYGSGLRQVWLKTSVIHTPPGGARYEKSEDIGDGFTVHYVSNTD